MVSYAAQVPEPMARTVAAHFLRTQTGAFHDLAPEALFLAEVAEDPAPDGTGTRVLYRVYEANGSGFIILAGDDLVQPVLAWSAESRYDPQNMPVNARKWLEGYRAGIRAALEEGLPASATVAGDWAWLVQQGEAPVSELRDVAPLVQTTWDQAPHYNALCPGGSVTGCVATAMAQIMKYHGHPQQGSGFHSYNDPNYGTQSANFGATTYNWAAMPNNVSGPNNAVATLMYHLGVSVDMQYSPQISGAWVIQAHSPTTDHNSEYALKTYFGYDPAMQGLKRQNFTQGQWINMLKSDLDAGRPVLYAGWGSGGGHAFVCDGYDNNDFFHFNWGWGGAFNGNFTVNALNPDGVGTGGGTGGYNDGQQALFGIRPLTGGGPAPDPGTMQLNAPVVPSAGTINYGQAFSVSTNVVNNGSGTFQGDYCVAVFDENDIFYGYVQTLTNYELPAGYTYNNNLVFSTNGLFSMLPGTYRVGAFYRPTGGEWVLLANNGGYTNLTQVQVVHAAPIELYAPITVAGGGSVAQGSSLSVSLNVINTSATTFYGQYGVGLFNLDGTLAQEVGFLNENNGLPFNYTYNNNLIFGPATVTVQPGTYLLALQYNYNNTGWVLAGSSNHSNPVFLNVVAPGLAPDPYEANNTAAQAYTLPVNFSGNHANVQTTGSNLHSPTDQDFYKVVLPAGLNYAISARLHDSYNSGNGNTYTVDGMVSWSTNGTTWSPVHDDIVPGAIVAANGGTVYFHVAPYFQGETGTYLLQLDIERGPEVSVAETDGPAGIRVFPNPAQDRVIVDLTAFDGVVQRVQVLDMQGRVLHEEGTAPRRGGPLVIHLGDVPAGTCLVRITTDRGVRTERITVVR
ncbi:MAG: thiol protease/hemagglutinin PrtT [Flavobacteriales bacterium]|nr:thiol protease/hemagglutinin PrtT [Flavobacteriales bacterium]